MDIPKRLQQQYGVGPSEPVTFIQTNATPGRHRDGIRFRNNQEILLQYLAEGQRARVLSTGCSEDFTAEPRELFDEVLSLR
jgi:hypothetical protein